jgi:biotin operon repressor
MYSETMNEEPIMAVNTRTEYALRALLEITDSQQDAVSAQKICEHQELPKKYIERLLGNLKAAGLIISSAGAKGGYVLAKGCGIFYPNTPWQASMKAGKEGRNEARQNLSGQLRYHAPRPGSITGYAAIF